MRHLHQPIVRRGVALAHLGPHLGHVEQQHLVPGHRLGRRGLAVPVLVRPPFTLLDLDQAHVDTLAAIGAIHDPLPETDLEDADRGAVAGTGDHDLEGHLGRVRHAALGQGDLVLDLVLGCVDDAAAALVVARGSGGCRVLAQDGDVGGGAGGCEGQAGLDQGGSEAVGDLAVGCGQALGQGVWQLECERVGMLSRAELCGGLLVLVRDEWPGVFDVRCGRVAGCGRISVL